MTRYDHRKRIQWDDEDIVWGVETPDVSSELRDEMDAADLSISYPCSALYFGDEDSARDAALVLGGDARVFRAVPAPSGDYYGGYIEID